MTGGARRQMAPASAMYPCSRRWRRCASEGDKVDGTPVLTTLDLRLRPEPRAAGGGAAAGIEGGRTPASAGGLGGMFARKMMKKKTEDAAAAAPGNAAPGHATVMTMVNEMLSMSKDVTAADVAVPEGFKEEVSRWLLGWRPADGESGGWRARFGGRLLQAGRGFDRTLTVGPVTCRTVISRRARAPRTVTHRPRTAARALWYSRSFVERAAAAGRAASGRPCALSSVG